MKRLPTWRELNADTSPEVEAKQFELLRAMSPARKMELFTGLYQDAFRMAYQGIKRRHPDATEEELRFRMIELMYGREWAERLCGDHEPEQ